VFPLGETAAIVLYLLLLNVCAKLCTEVKSIQTVLQEIRKMMICVGPLINYTVIL
jgi:hypothetical protein